MSDGANSTNEHEQGANEQGEHWITVREAADRLHIGVRGVQQRIARGKIRHKREGERLLVCLEHAPFTDNPQDEQREHGEQKDANSEQPANEQEANNANNALVDALTDDIAFLRSELTAQREQHTQEIQRRDVAELELRRLLLADRQEIARLREQLAIVAAPASVEPEPAAVVVVETAVQDTPHASQEPHREVERAPVDNPASEGGSVSAGQIQRQDGRKWWQVWRR